MANTKRKLWADGNRYRGPIGSYTTVVKPASVADGASSTITVSNTMTYMRINVVNASTYADMKFGIKLDGTTGTDYFYTIGEKEVLINDTNDTKNIIVINRGGAAGLLCVMHG